LGIKYRRRSKFDRTPDVHPPMGLEIAWTAIPLIIVMVIFAWGAKLYVEIYSPPDDAMDIHVVGKQWMWKIQHPQGRREINELHLPLGQPIKLILTSQDVIHDFGLPAFRMKQDVVPGMYTTECFVPTQLGEYHLFCDQYCGTRHA